ncbi:MAG: DUF4440 domain-containing protein [Acidobacteriaceae bacterium]|nr:DUF4440 domain-containing protein [Acidobacteriaceae bacterium]
MWRAAQQTGADQARAAMLQTDRDFAKTGAARDLDAFLSFVADDVRIFPEGAMATGKPAMRAMWEGGFKEPTWSIHWAPIAAEACASGDLGYTTGTYETRSQGSDGRPVVHRGSYVTIWRKQGDGRWKVALDIGSAAPQTATTTPAAAEGSEKKTE